MKKYLLTLLIPINTFAQIIVTNGLTQEFKSTANGKITGQIKLRNAGKKPETFLASKFEIVFNCGSYGVFSDTETNDRSLNNWLEFDIDEKSLNPNEEYDLVFRINVPEDASGTYWSAVMVERGDPLAVPGLFKITNKARYAVQLIVNVGSYEMPMLNYKHVTINKNPANAKGKIINVELENTGFFSSFVKTQIELYNEKGVKVQTVKGENKNIYPSRCNIYNIELNNMQPGKYDGVIMADTGKKIFGSNVTIQID